MLILLVLLILLVETVETVETAETELTEDLKKYQLLHLLTQLLTDSLKARDASASKKYYHSSDGGGTTMHSKASISGWTGSYRDNYKKPSGTPCGQTNQHNQNV